MYGIGRCDDVRVVYGVEGNQVVEQWLNDGLRIEGFKKVTRGRRLLYFGIAIGLRAGPKQTARIFLRRSSNVVYLISKALMLLRVRHSGEHPFQPFQNWYACLLSFTHFV
jgi:hypothetical protein